MKYLIEDTTLQNMAKRIREKTGKTERLTPEQMLIDIANLPPLTIGDMPDYVQTEAERVVAIVKALQNENTLTTIHATDIHVSDGEQSRVSALHLAQAVHIIKRLIPIDALFVHGDIVSGAGADSLETHLDNHMYVRRVASIFDPDAEMSGNHDANIYNAECYMLASELYKYLGRRNVKPIKPETEADRNYFYIDIKNTRFICLNTADLKDVSADSPQDGHHISKYQFQWLVDVLGTTLTDGISNIILQSHHPLHWAGSMPNVQTILDAYINGTSGSIIADDETISFDFSGKNGAKILGTVHGHTHNLISGKVGDNEIIRLGIPNGCFGRNNEYGSSSYSDEFRQKYGEVEVAADGALTTVYYLKTANTAQDTAFVVNVWDLEQEAVNSICYGAGYDRTLSWGGTVYYSVTNIFSSGITTDNQSASVKSGDAYQATLSLEANYSLTSLIVTMGGVDVSSECVDGLTISISEVTGDIEITAITTGYTNVIDAVGYTDGYRLSTSTGELKAATGYVTTGAIEVNQGDIIRTKGVDFRYSNNSYCAKAQYTDGVFDAAGYLNEHSGEGFTLSFDDEGNMTFTVGTAIADGQELRFCGYGSGDKLIITVNEEIPEDATPDTSVTYTNQIPIATDIDGAVFNGTGYKENYRFNSSGGESTAEGWFITGLIPCKKGDIIRIYGDTTDIGASYGQVKTYDANKESIQTGYYSFTYHNENGDISLDGSVKVIDTGNTVDETYYKDTMEYIRLCLQGTASEVVITINEEII